MDAELREIFARNLNHFLEVNGFSQADMARHMKVSTATAANWCSGKIMPRVDKIQSLCNWFGCEKSELLEDSADSKDYYFDADVREMAEFLHKNPAYKVLFDASRNVKPEDIDFVKQMIDRMGGGND